VGPLFRRHRYGRLPCCGVATWRRGDRGSGASSGTNSSSGTNI